MNRAEVWNHYYKEIHGISFYMDAKEAKNLKLLEDKVKRHWLDQGHLLEPNQVLDALGYFLKHIEDEFTLDQLTPSMVNSRFNIINQQQNSKRVKKTETIKFRIEAPTPKHLEEIAQIKRAYESQKNKFEE